MPQAREHPYIWTTWLAKLLAGDAHCQWAGWFRAHYQELDQAALGLRQRQVDDWTHTALLNREKGKQRIAGLHSLRGKPEFLPPPRTVRHPGRKARSHRSQEQRRRDNRRQDRQSQPSPLRPSNGLPIRRPQSPRPVPWLWSSRGHVAYTESNLEIPASRIDTNFVNNMAALIRRLANDTPAVKVPSYDECRFCDITSADCPERVDGRPDADTATTDDF